jgi:hypothetical protein
MIEFGLRKRANGRLSRAGYIPARAGHGRFSTLTLAEAGTSGAVELRQ